jgi:hypothetical protein
MKRLFRDERFGAFTVVTLFTLLVLSCYIAFYMHLWSFL